MPTSSLKSTCDKISLLIHYQSITGQLAMATAIATNSWKLTEKHQQFASFVGSAQKSITYRVGDRATACAAHAAAQSRLHAVSITSVSAWSQPHCAKVFFSFERLLRNVQCQNFLDLSQCLKQIRRTFDIKISK